MSMSYEFDDEALRLLVNLEQRYAAWMDAERSRAVGSSTSCADSTVNHAA